MLADEKFWDVFVAADREREWLREGGDRRRFRLAIGDGERAPRCGRERSRRRRDGESAR